MSLWKDVKKTVKDGFTVATEKTEEYTKIAKVKVEILTTKKDLDKSYRDLGKKAFDHLASDKKTALAQSSGVKELLDQIKTYKTEIHDNEAEIEKIKKEADGKSKAKNQSVKPEAKPEPAPVKKSAPKAKKTPAKKVAAKKTPVKK
ncbi:MAG: hypothetical protein JRD93_19430 [Deltaproteobacteria bacterium]|nr:hypothetical protein [Deltaproteobacteria bacterium]